MSVFSKLKQFKDMRDQGKKLQAALKDETASATAAGGQVSIVLDGNLKINRLEIAPEMMSPDKKERLQSAVKEAHNEALERMQKIISGKVRETGVTLPGMN